MDTVAGGNNYDTLDGGDGNDKVWGGNGRDKVYLGNGNDVFYDNTQNDQHGHDTVFGGSGNDTINGGGGNNILTGGTGVDSFKFNASQSHGTNVITDFVRGTDILEMSGLTFSDLNFQATGSGVRIEWTDGSVKMDNVNIIDIDQSDFLFV